MYVESFKRERDNITDRHVELITNMGLSKQQELISADMMDGLEGAQPFPFAQASLVEKRIMQTLAPDLYPIKDYEQSEIPVEVLEIINGIGVEFTYRNTVLYMCITKGRDEYFALMNNYRYRAYGSVIYPLAYWAKKKSTEDQRRARAVKQIKEKMISQLRVIEAQVSTLPDTELITKDFQLTTYE